MADDDRRWVGRGQHEEGGEKAGVTPKQIAAGVLALALLVFVLQNTDSTSITLLVLDVTFPLWLVLSAAIAVSVGIGYLLGSRRRRR
jgi:uncharacterized integral membrane protein